jgi:hypothetical protein
MVPSFIKGVVIILNLIVQDRLSVLCDKIKNILENYSYSYL